MSRSAPREMNPRGGRLSGGLLSNEEFVEAVLRTVEAIPPGKVLAYGDVAELLGIGGPRSVGKVMSGHGAGVPWWRVIRADGSPPQCDEAGARQAWLAEGTPLRPTGKVDMRRARWDGRSSDDDIPCVGRGG
ncbi:MAG TPA: MGMT family protein [Sporichthya sp.]|nr:MGMT family protein [Sporichthya sp.]